MSGIIFANADANTNTNVDANTDADTDANSNTDSDADSNADTDADSNADACVYCWAKAVPSKLYLCVTDDGRNQWQM